MPNYLRLKERLLTLLWHASSQRRGVYREINRADKNALSTLPQQDFATTIENLRSLLKKTPTWLDGHILLGSASLRIDDVATSYASAQVALHLSNTQKIASSREDALLLLGRCFLRRGNAVKAIELLSGIGSNSRILHQALEELAAAHMLLDDHISAKSALLKIPPLLLSAEGKAALSYLANKNTVTHHSS